MNQPSAKATEAPVIRQVIVRRGDSKQETLILLTIISVILVAMIIRFSLVGGNESQMFLRPFMKLNTVLAGQQPIIYQALFAAVPEIIDLRDTEGQWPEAELLDIEQIPPFAKQFLPKDLQSYVWEGFDNSAWIDYVGQNPGGSEPVTFCLRLIDLHTDYHPNPHPGIDYDPKQKVAVQVWAFPAPNRAYPGERLAEDGWFWIVRPDDPILQKPADQKIIDANAVKANKTTQDSEGTAQ